MCAGGLIGGGTGRKAGPACFDDVDTVGAGRAPMTLPTLPLGIALGATARGAAPIAVDEEPAPIAWRARTGERERVHDLVRRALVVVGERPRGAFGRRSDGGGSTGGAGEGTNWPTLTSFMPLERMEL